MRRIGLAVVLALSLAAEAQDDPQKYKEPPALVPTRGPCSRGSRIFPHDRISGIRRIGMSHVLLAQRFARALLLVASAAVLTLVLQHWVGRATIYSEEFAGKRSALHTAILKNEPPRGGWHHIGANGDNIRVFAVYLAESLRWSTALPVTTGYFLIDSVALFLTFVLLFFYGRRWVSEPYCVIGLLYFGCVTVLTYQLHFFHPWDRLWLLSWMVLIMLVWDHRLVPLALLLPIGVGQVGHRGAARTVLAYVRVEGKLAPNHSADGRIAGRFVWDVRSPDHDPPWRLRSSHDDRAAARAQLARLHGAQTRLSSASLAHVASSSGDSRLTRRRSPGESQRALRCSAPRATGFEDLRR